jgi:hypothetical protein
MAELKRLPSAECRLVGSILRFRAFVFQALGTYLETRSNLQSEQVQFWEQC